MASVRNAALPAVMRFVQRPWIPWFFCALLVLYIMWPAEHSQRVSTPFHAAAARTEAATTHEEQARSLQPRRRRRPRRADDDSDSLQSVGPVAPPHVACKPDGFEHLCAVNVRTKEDTVCAATVTSTSPVLDTYEFLPVAFHSLRLLVPSLPADPIREAVKSSGTLVCPHDLLAALDADAKAGTPAVLLDLGANVGSCTLAAAAAGHRAIAVEPVPSNVAAVRANLRENAASIPASARAWLLPIAVGDAVGEFEIVLDPRNIGNNVVVDAPNATAAIIGDADAARIHVCVDTVDALLADASGPGGEKALSAALSSVRYIKIDVQGHELRALRGLRRLLALPSLIALFIEVSPGIIAQHGDSVFEMFDILSSSGFSAIIFNGQPATREQWQAVFTPAAIANAYWFTDLLIVKDGVKLPA